MQGSFAGWSMENAANFRPTSQIAGEKPRISAVSSWRAQAPAGGVHCPAAGAEAGSPSPAVREVTTVIFRGAIAIDHG